MPRNLLRDAVFVQLLSCILRGDYRRGQRLRLDEIAEDMRVSRTPVREALVPLEMLRLVVVQRYVGVVIAHWTIEHVVERLHITRMMVDDASRQRRDGPPEPVDIGRLRACASDAGVAMVLAEWVLRAARAPVSADWVASQFPLIDQVFTPDIAELHGVDVSSGRRTRAAAADRVRELAMAGDVVAVRTATIGLLDALVELLGRFRAGGTAVGG